MEGSSSRGMEIHIMSLRNAFPAQRLRQAMRIQKLKVSHVFMVGYQKGLAKGLFVTDLLLHDSIAQIDKRGITRPSR
jgi:hypothetical protein